MINPAIMQLKIELTKAKNEFSEQELKLKRLFWEIQTFINPYYKSMDDIKAEEIVQCAKEMLKTKNTLLTLEKTIQDIKTHIGDI